VNFATGPAGALYVVDFYRKFVEHPDWVHGAARSEVPWRTGAEHGRIWRIRNLKSNIANRKPNLSPASWRERAQSLHDGNGWWRDTAQRLLVERQDHVARPAIEKMAHQASSPLGRLHALHTLDGLHALTPAILLGALQEDSAVVREHAVGLSERWVASTSEADDTVLRSQIKALRAEGKSLMPEGLEQGLAMQEMADLLAFLQKPEGRLLPEVK